MDLLRPRTLFRTLARADRLADDVKGLQAQIDQLIIRVEQLTSIERLKWEHQRERARLDTVLDAARLEAHVTAAIEAAALEVDPFPHIVVADWLPADAYEALVRSVPPPVFFADREERRQRLMVPFEIAPDFSQRVWRFVSSRVVSGALSRALNDKFRPLVESYVSTFCPQLPSDADLTLHASDGRIMLRRPGYVIEPHRDPKWGFLTGLVYLADTADHEACGTQLYRVRSDVDGPTGGPYYIDPSRCELVKTVPFRPNTLLVFLNSHGAHGASIPADATPPDLIRLVYQFRMGPSAQGIRRMLSCMAPEHRASWEGSKSHRFSAANASDRD